MQGRPLIPAEKIERHIIMLRSEKVILDKDLAALYGATTGNLNKAVSRNKDRFPGDFMFQLNKKEFEDLKFHFGTSSWGGTRKLKALEQKYDRQFAVVFKAIRKLMEPPDKTQVRTGSGGKRRNDMQAAGENTTQTEKWKDRQYNIN